MKKVICGFIAGTIITTGVNVIASGVIQSAEFNNVGVSYNGQQLELNQALLSVETVDNDSVINYMPVRDVLEGMGYTVNWNGGNNMIEITNGATIINNNVDLNNIQESEWISRIDVTGVYSYSTEKGMNGAGVYLNRGDTEPLFFSEVGAEDNVVRIIRDGNDFKFNRQDLLDLGIDLTPKE